MIEPPILFLLLALLCAVGFIVIMVRRSQAAAAEERLADMRLEADRFFAELRERKKLPVIPVDIVLKQGEVGVFQEPSTLLETRAVRVYGGGGTRIRGVYVGGGASESHQRLRQIDSGSLTLTNQRLVFDGGNENRSVRLNDILSAKAWQDAIEVSTSRRQKSQIYTVKNPILWATMIQELASGNIAVPEGAKIVHVPDKEF